MLLKIFPVLSARAVRTWYRVHYFRCPCFWQTLFRASGCCLGVLESWIFREMSLSLGALLGSTVVTRSASVLLASDVFHTFSTLRRTRILERSFSSGCCLSLRGSHLETLDVPLRFSRG